MPVFMIQWLTRGKDKTSEQGFTTVEVLVGILLTIIFMIVAMQTIALAAAIRVRAQEASDAARWVKNDRDMMVRQASSLGGYDSATGTYSSISASRCSATTGTTGFASLLQAQPDNSADANSADSTIGTDDTDPKLSPIGSRGYTLRRRTSVTDANPHILKVQYDVYRGLDTSVSPIYRYYTEVIPGVAFACKQI
jgi:type II secretory pathway pseudopilin PulG